MPTRDEAPDAAGLAHDLNNILETIGEAAELLSTEAGAAGLAATISRNVDRGRRLVEGFAHQHLAPAELDLVVERAADFVRDLTRLLGRAEVRFDREFGAGVKLKGSASEWERVFMNLFLNAAQAMGEGGAIRVGLERDEGRVAITVTDEGPGIPPEILPRIFQPNVTTRGEHSGLGLHIVDTIVRRHGGTVTAANREGRRGALFCISAPVG